MTKLHTVALLVIMISRVSFSAEENRSAKKNSRKSLQQDVSRLFGSFSEKTLVSSFFFYFDTQSRHIDEAFSGTSLEEKLAKDYEEVLDHLSESHYNSREFFELKKKQLEIILQCNEKQLERLKALLGSKDVLLTSFPPLDLNHSQYKITSFLSNQKEVCRRLVQVFLSITYQKSFEEESSQAILKLKGLGLAYLEPKIRCFYEKLACCEQTFLCFVTENIEIFDQLASSCQYKKNHINNESYVEFLLRFHVMYSHYMKGVVEALSVIPEFEKHERQVLAAHAEFTTSCLEIDFALGEEILRPKS